MATDHVSSIRHPDRYLRNASSGQCAGKAEPGWDSIRLDFHLNGDPFVIRTLPVFGDHSLLI